MLATATGSCGVRNVTYNENTYYVVTWTVYVIWSVYLESWMYLRWRQWLRQIVVMCHLACWFRSGAVLKFDQFYHSSFWTRGGQTFSTDGHIEDFIAIEGCMLALHYIYNRFENL